MPSDFQPQPLQASARDRKKNGEFHSSMSSDEVMAGTTVVMTHSQRQAFLKTSYLGQLLGVADLLPEVEEVTDIK